MLRGTRNRTKLIFSLSSPSEIDDGHLGDVSIRKEKTQKRGRWGRRKRNRAYLIPQRESQFPALRVKGEGMFRVLPTAILAHRFSS